MNLLILAKQGDARAIAALMNRHLQPKGITVVKAAFKNGCLQIMLEAAQVPEQQALVAFVRKGITSLEPESIKQVKVYARQIGEEFPAWSHEFELLKQITPTSHSASLTPAKTTANLTGYSQTKKTQVTKIVAEQPTQEKIAREVTSFNRTSLTVLSILIIAGLGFALLQITGNTESRVRQLLATKKCEGCDLSGAKICKTSGEKSLQFCVFEKIDLTGAKLSRANLKSADLSYTNLNGADLKGANLTGAKLPLDLEGADLRDADLFGANFPTGARLIGAKLNQANLSHAKLRSAVFTNADLSHANLNDADLSVEYIALGGASFSRANLTEATLSGANLTGAFMMYANLSHTNLSNANLTSAELSEANLTGSDLSSVSMRSAKLYGTNFTNATLIGADLSDAELSDFDGTLKSAKLCSAIMPDGTTHPC